MKNLEKITVTNRDEAWVKAAELFPTIYVRDDRLSERAGYPIYISITPGHENDHISDLGCRLELNIGNDSTNIWVVENIRSFGDNVSVVVTAETGETREYETYEAYAKDFRFFWSSGRSTINSDGYSAERHFCKMIEALENLDEDGMTLSSSRNGLTTTLKYHKFSR